MPFTTLTRWLQPATPKTRRTPLQVNSLEDRCTPSATLQDVNGNFSAAGNRPSNLLGQSDDGRFIIFESKATNLVVGQSDIPDTNDLFWRDMQTGETRMVTALPKITQTNYDYAATRLSPDSFALQAIVDGGAVLPSFNRAVISGDGQFVGLSTVVNAARLDQDYATSVYAPFSNSTVNVDVPNTLDVFRWEAKSGEIQLVSRTAANAQTQGKLVAFGRFGGADTPAISSDGRTVGFVSRVDAWIIDSKGRPTGLGAGIIVDGGNTNDIFATAFDDNIGVQVDVLSAGLTSPENANGPIFTRTYGHGAGGNGVEADLQGRYLGIDAGGKLNIVGIAAVDPGAFLGTGYRTDIAFVLVPNTGNIATTTTNTVTGGPNYEAWRWSILPGIAEDARTDELITATGTGTFPFFGFTGVTTNGGSASSIIIARGNSSTILVTTSTVGINGNFSPFPLAPSAKRQDLYYVRQDLNNVTVRVLNNSSLPALAANPVLPDASQFNISPNGKYLVFAQNEGVLADGVTAKSQVFYRQVLPTLAATNTRISVDANGLPLDLGASSPRLSRNGRFVTFQSATPADIVVSSNLTDFNNSNDIFIRDLFAGKNNFGQFVPTTRLVSINNAGTGTAAGASTNAFVTTALEDPTFGTTPNLDEDSVGRVVFNSTATDIDIRLPILHKGSSIYMDDLPLDGLPPIVPPTDAPRVAVISGGRESGVSLIGFSGSGTVTLGQRLTPYQGFAGEIRTASADVDGDGILDLITVPGPGAGPRVVVFSGANETRLFDFFAYEPGFRGGVNIVSGDINGDGKAEIIVGADKGGGARVRVLDMTAGATGKALVDFFAYDVNFRGGVRVALGDVNGDGFDDVITGAGTGGGPRVSAFSGFDINGGNLNRFVDFFALELNLRNGVTVASEDFDNDGFDDILVGSGAGGAPRVRVFEAKSVIASPAAPDLLYDFFAGNTNSRAGIRVAAKNVDGDAIVDIVTGEGFGNESRIRTFSGAKFSAPLTPTELNNTFVVFDDLTSLNGAWVG